jgi:hypothetical protein
VSLIRPAWVPRPTPVNFTASSGTVETHTTDSGERGLSDHRRGERRTSEDRDGVSTALRSPRTRPDRPSDTAQDHHTSEDTAANTTRLNADTTASTATSTLAPPKVGEPPKEEDTAMDDLTRSFDAVLEFVPRGVRKREKRKVGSGMDMGV